MTTLNKPNKGFWIISIIALLWNLMGVNQYLQQAFMTDSFKEMYNEEQLQMIIDSPSWATAAFAIAVFAGAIGSLLLLLRKQIAKSILILSLIGIIVQIYHNFFVIDSMAIYGPGALAMPIMILGVAIFLIWYTDYSSKKGWMS
ncbi:hypothetical protein [uncultured Flavobacterium sp.]|uniref:hypothetical protein n=1 Tax=uncultured Flavobacterium sp. TaxID=165435 RepID=UPI0030EE344D|tara:strand:- start:38638 stop:39069 length:432 start_codon:yes stop_codon:yes gene_type:complete